MKRLHLFEFHDLPWYPGFLRESTVETLSLALRYGRCYDEAARALVDLAAGTGATKVLDLCSGAGEPVAIFADRVAAAGERLTFTLTDLYPNRGAFEAVAGRYPGVVDFRSEPVDATAVPAELDHGIRTVVSAFHHFRPELARRILAAAVADRKAIFVVEAMPRSLWRFSAFLVHGARAALVHPFRTRRRRWLKLLTSTIVPLLPVLGTFDGVVSTLRIYTPAELDALVEGLAGDYVWEHGRSRYAPWGIATWFAGYPRPS